MNQPRDDAPLWEQTQLWPLRLTFLDVDGVTLWGTAHAADGRDRVLVERGQLVLAADAATLRRYITADTHSTLSGFPGYEQLREQIRSTAVALEPTLTFDYRAVAAAISRPHDDWTRDQCADLLDALNMLSDIAATLADDQLLAEFDHPAFTTLQQRLTFLDDDESCADTLNDVDLDAINHLVGMAIDCAQHHARVLPPTARN